MKMVWNQLLLQKMGAKYFDSELDWKPPQGFGQDNIGWLKYTCSTSKAAFLKIDFGSEIETLLYFGAVNTLAYVWTQHSLCSHHQHTPRESRYQIGFYNTVINGVLTAPFCRRKKFKVGGAVYTRYTVF